MDLRFLHQPVSFYTDWIVGQGEPDGSRTVIAFFPKGNTSSSGICLCIHQFFLLLLLLFSLGIL